MQKEAIDGDALLAIAVQRISHNWMLHPREVDAELVRAACAGSGVHEREESGAAGSGGRGGIQAGGLVVGHGGAHACGCVLCAGGKGGLSFACGWMPAQRNVDAARFGRDTALQ